MAKSNQTPTSRLLRPGQFLFRESEASHSVYLIKKGTISIRKAKKNGQVEIARIYANEILGELSFFDRCPRSAAAVALTEVEALEIPFQSLDKIFASVPVYFKSIMASVSERLRKADELIRRLQTELVNDADVLKLEEFSAGDALAALEEQEAGGGAAAAAVENDSPVTEDDPPDGTGGSASEG